MYEKLKAIATYCGEDFDPMDPSRILRVVRDFMRLFEKSLADIRVHTGCRTLFCCRRSIACTDMLSWQMRS